jgi:hypothetical protein
MAGVAVQSGSAAGQPEPPGGHLPTGEHGASRTASGDACGRGTTVRRGALLIASLSLVLATTLVMLSRDRSLDRDPAYSVVEVEARLARDPQAWAHRTLLLRGMALHNDCFMERSWLPCASPQALLVDANHTAAVRPLPLAWAVPDSLLAIVRRMPLLGAFAPMPQLIRWDAVAPYRVQLRPRANRSCGGVTCYEAVVLDAEQ